MCSVIGLLLLYIHLNISYEIPFPHIDIFFSHSQKQENFYVFRDMMVWKRANVEKNTISLVVAGAKALWEM